jgi:hypothetical protein
MPLLSVETSDEMPGILEVRQRVQFEDLPSLDEVMSKTPIKTQADQNAPSSGLNQITMSQLDIFSRRQVKPFRVWTKEELEGYNQRVRWYYDSYKKYLIEVAEYRLLLQRSTTMHLVLVNRGTRPATDIWAKITFPDGVLVYEEDDLPTPPEAPTPPAFAPNGIGSPIIRQVQHFADLLRPSPRIAEDHTTLIFRTDKIQQGFQAIIKSFRAVMNNKEDIRSFSAAYQITSDELPRQTTGELYLEIKLVDE